MVHDFSGEVTEDTVASTFYFLGLLALGASSCRARRALKDPPPPTHTQRPTQEESRPPASGGANLPGV